MLQWGRSWARAPRPGHNGLANRSRFRQYRDFLYFTGLEVPASVLALDADSGATTLFAPAEDWRFANPSRRNDFPGRPLADDPSLGRVSGISRIFRFTEFDPYLRKLVAAGRALRMSADYRGPLRPLETPPPRPWNANPALRLHIERAHPDAEIRNAYEQLARLRMVKSPLEVAVMRRAAEVTARAILEAARIIGSGVPPPARPGAALGTRSGRTLEPSSVRVDSEQISDVLRAVPLLHPPVSRARTIGNSNIYRKGSLSWSGHRTPWMVTRSRPCAWRRGLWRGGRPVLQVSARPRYRLHPSRDWP